MRIWSRTLLPPAITAALYFIIFGNLIGPRIGDIEGFPYIKYIAPGLIMLSVITSTYTNVTASFFLAKFQRNIEELLISPVPNYLILLGFVAGGIIRGLLVGIIVSLVTLFFTHLEIRHIFITFTVIFLTAALFSLAGFLNGVLARTFDDIEIFPTFVLTPLTYLGGVFYSIKMLPVFWQHLSQANPILYMVNAFRFGMLGASDINVYTALIMIMFCIVILFSICLYLLNKGVGIRT